MLWLAIVVSVILLIIKLTALLTLSWWVVVLPLLIWAGLVAFWFVVIIFFFGWALKVAIVDELKRKIK